MASIVELTFTVPAETNKSIRLNNESIRRTISSSLLPFTGVIRIGARVSMHQPSGTHATLGGSPKFILGLQAGSSQNILGDPGVGNDYNATHFVGAMPHSTVQELGFDASDDHYGYSTSLGDHWVPARVTNKLLTEQTIANNFNNGAIAGESPNEICPIFLELDFGASTTSVGMRVFAQSYGLAYSGLSESGFLAAMNASKGGLTFPTTVGHYLSAERTLNWATDYATDTGTYGNFDTLVVGWNSPAAELQIHNLAVAVIST